MRFKKFLETALSGYYHDKETAEPTYAGRPLNLPDMRMQLGQEKIEGAVIAAATINDKIKLRIRQIDGSELTVTATLTQLRKHGKELPQRGNHVTLLMNADGTLGDWRMNH